MGAVRLSDSGQILDWPALQLVGPDGSVDRYLSGFVATPSALFLVWLDARSGGSLSDCWISRVGNDGSLVGSTSIDVGSVTALWLPQAGANDREILIAAKGVNGACRHLWNVDLDLHVQGPASGLFVCMTVRGGFLVRAFPTPSSAWQIWR